MLLYEMPKQKGISYAEAKDTHLSILDQNRSIGKENKPKY